MYNYGEENALFGGSSREIESADTDGNGMLDTFVSIADTDGDGVEDTIIKSFDYNQDGIIDTSTSYTDLNGDGVIDAVSKIIDSDYDGVADRQETFVDYDGDGVPDDAAALAYDQASGTIIPLSSDYFIDSLDSVQSTYAEQLDNFDPSESNPALVSGDPATSMEEWEFQGSTNRCALYSQKFVIQELTGEEVDIEEMEAIAEQNGWFNDGTAFLNMNKMLDLYGIENEMSFNNDISDIKECLDNGGKVIVSIDSDEIWRGEDHNIFSPMSGADHAVEVIGIDNTDPNNPMVILNDSGSPNGCGEMVPLDTFVDAWEDGNCQMITCYA